MPAGACGPRRVKDIWSNVDDVDDVIAAHDFDFCVRKLEVWLFSADMRHLSPFLSLSFRFAILFGWSCSPLPLPCPFLLASIDLHASAPSCDIGFGIGSVFVSSLCLFDSFYSLFIFTSDFWLLIHVFYVDAPVRFADTFPFGRCTYRRTSLLCSPLLVDRES